MKQSSFIISMIIPGPLSPGKDIDIFLQPLINEINQLWEGVQTFDASKQENFKMCVAAKWTINDFSAYANLSGRSTKGKYACPYYVENIEKNGYTKVKSFAIWAIAGGYRKDTSFSAKSNFLMAMKSIDRLPIVQPDHHY